MEKVGRNDPCPCRSGKKYKKCCLDKATIEEDISLQFAKLQARQKQIEKQQGLGRSIISIEHKGYRLIAVGSRICYSKKWKTFHDFLFDNIKFIFGKEWGESELKKPFEERHHILQWQKMAHDYMQEHKGQEGQINSAPLTGALSALVNLSYNLYLLAHNGKIQDYLIHRLKNKDLFTGALYETYVAGIFILAGFTLELEDESDSSSSHCEFTASARETGERYSVEAKARQPFKKDVGIGNQLYEALKKEAKYKRIIFIDLNVPSLVENLQKNIDELKKKETTLKIDGKPAPSSYVFLTNHSYAYDLTGCKFERGGFAYGFKIDDFNNDGKPYTIREILATREKHKDMEGLIKSIKEHNDIPVTFDGEIPEFAFNGEARKNRLLIGSRCIIPDGQGNDVVGVLMTATVSEKEKKIFGVYRLDNGKQVICTNPMSDEEVLAYQRYPDTFFGVPLNQSGEAKDPMELFDFFYNTYKKTPPEKLLEFMKNASDIEELKKLSPKELAITYCERLVYSIVNDHAKKPSEKAGG
jgi:hypothetical protein